MKKLLVSIASLAVSGAAFAQATASGVTGLVTATSGNQLINVTNGMAIPPGAVVSATGSGTVTLTLPGCVATLGPGQSMTATEADCKSFVASAGSGSGAGGGTFVTPRNVALTLGGLGILSYATRGNGNNGATVVLPVTPTTPGTPATPAVVVTPVTPVSGS